MINFAARTNQRLSEVASEKQVEIDGIRYSRVQARLFQNSAIVLVCRFVMTAVGLISVPVVVTKLGIAGYGTWEAILGIAGLIATFQTAISGTLTWKMSEAFGRNDPSEMKRLARVGVGIMLLLLAIVWPFVWIFRADIVAACNTPAAFSQSAALILPGVVAQVLLGGINETFGALLGGFQRFGWVTLIQSFSAVINTVIVILCLFGGWELWSLFAGYFAGFLITSIVLYFAAGSICGPINIWPSLPDRGDVKSLGAYAGFMIIGSVSISLRDHADRLILAALASPAWVGYFGIALRLTNLVALPFSLLNIPIVPAVGALHARGDWAAVRSLFSSLTILVACSTGALVILIAGLHERIVLLWVGKRIPEVGPILYLLLFGVAVCIFITGVGTALCKGLGRVEIETKYVVVSLALNIVLKVAFVRTFGAMGAVASSALSWVVGAALFVPLMYRAIDLPKLPTLKAFGVLAVTAAVVAGAHLLSRQLPFGGNAPQMFANLTILAAVLLGLYGTLLVGLRLVPFATIRAAISKAVLFRPSFS